MATPTLDPQRVSAPLNVFISYAHEDEALKDKLIKHLSALKRQGIIAEWHDRKILPGGNWAKQIDSHLESSQIILLLISPDFLDSDYCYDVEMTRALEKDRNHEARVIPVFLRPCDWKGMPFGHLQGLPLDAKAVTEWPNRDKAFEAVAQGIRMVAAHFRLPVADRIKQQVGIAVTDKATSLHQLPPPTADFTGRTDEIAELLEAVKKQGVAITGMYGMGGIGKTALGLKIADQLRKDYPDAQIYLDLRGIEKSPLLAKEAMAHVIRSFDLAAKVPESEAEITALYRSVLHNKKALLLMDNAKDEQQVKLLVPPDGSLLIVTSRQHFRLPGLFDKNLEVLSVKDAKDLLCRIAPRLKKESKKTIEELVSRCGFLPLALETVANSLKVRIDLNPNNYSARLKDARERLKLTAADASLELSYQLLPSELQQRFRMLAVFPGTFDSAAAAAVWEAESLPAREALGELLLYSLIEFSEATSRYREHDLVRLFTDMRLTEEERETAQHRHAGHYLNVLRTADGLYEKGGDSVLEGLTLFDTEWGNIQAGQAWAAAHAKDDEVAAEWCSSFPFRGPYCLNLRQHPQNRIGWLEAALQAARRLKNRTQEGAMLGNLGVAYFDLGNYRRAVEYHEQALAIDREIGDRRGEGHALGNLGIAYDSLGEYRRAIGYHEQRLNIAREVGDQAGEGRALGNLGLAYDSLGEYRRAIEYHEQNLEIAREIGNRLSEAAAVGNLGGAYCSLGEYRRAIEYQEQRLQIARKIGYRLGEGHALGSLGLCYAGLSEHKTAIDYYEQGLKIFLEMGNRLGEANALFNSSLALRKLGDRANAIARAESALKIFDEIESPHASTVRDQLAKWREEEKAKSQAAE